MRARALVLFVAACGGNTEPPSAPSVSPTPSASSTATAAACAKPAPAIAQSGESVARPKGSALRFQLVHQGSSIAVSELRGVDMVLGPSDGPFEAGKNSGWWAELRSAAGAKIFTMLLHDPTTIEGPGAGGGLVHAPVDRCEPKIILVDVPNDPAGSELVVFGSADSAHGAPTRELARFTIR